MTETELRRLAALLHELNGPPPPPPKPSPIGAGTFLLGFLLICVTLLFWPELRVGLAGLYAGGLFDPHAYSLPAHALYGPG